MTRLGAGMLCLALSLACAPLTQRATASVGEFAAYRRYRIAGTVDARLAAGYDYLVRYPRGRFRSEVLAWFDPTGDAYVDAAWEDRDLLRRFLVVVPNGEAARRASARLVELELDERWHARRAAEFDARVRSIDARLEAARVGRRRLLKSMLEWTRLVSSLRRWGRRTHEQDHEFIYAFRLTEPEGRCHGDRCVKPLSLGYAIPEDKAQSERVALMDVVVDLHLGGVARVTLTGPELFTRLGEASFLRPILPTDLRGRTEALVRVRDLVQIAVERTMPEAECQVEPVSPILLHRRCEGTELMLIAAADASEEDRLVVQGAAVQATRAAESLPAAPTP